MTTICDELALWEALYKPVTNEFVDDETQLFETYGEEYEFVQKSPKENIWTWVDGDDGTYIVAGWHYVNRIGYFVTEKAWTDGDLVIAYEKYEVGV